MLDNPTEIRQAIDDLKETTDSMTRSSDKLDKVAAILEQGNETLDKLAKIIVAQQTILASALLELIETKQSSLYHIEALRSVISHSQTFLKEVGVLTKRGE